MVTPFRSNPFEQQTKEFLDRLRSEREQRQRDREARAAVSYTHLTLPTKRIV